MYIPLTEEQAIECALAVANDGDRHSLLKLVLGSEVPEDFGSVLVDEAKRQELVVDLGRLARQKESEKMLVAARLLPIYGFGFDPAVVAFPVPWIVHKAGKKIRRVDYRIVSPDARRAFGYALTILLDDGRELGARLRRCQLETCSHFFLKAKAIKGQSPNKYCSNDHQRQADRIMNADRVAAKRAHMTVEEWRKLK